MSTAFTAPADQTWQTLLSEITLAYDERRQAISQSAYLPPAWLTETTFATGEKCRYDGSFWESLQNANTNNLPEGLFRTWFPDQTYAVGEKLLYDGGYWASLQDDNTGNLPNEAESEWWEQAWWRPVQGTDVQAATYWVTLQSWLETECLSFIDHVNGPLNDDEDAFLYFTLTTWRTTAGLNSSGFRRSTDNGASYSYGQMQAGDQIGPWIFEDLQKGFGALKWVMGEGISEPNLLMRFGSHQNNYQSAAEAYDAALSDWNSHSWEEQEWYWQSTPQGKNCLIYQTSIGWYSCNLTGAMRTYSLSASSFCSRAFEVWTKVGYGLGWGVGGNSPHDQVFDANDDLLGAPVEFNIFVKVLEVADCVTEPVEVDYQVGDNAPNIAPSPDPYRVSDSGWMESLSNMLVKYSFTNA